jgi:hypothetical protein
MADLISGFSLLDHIARFIPALFVLVILYGILGFTQTLGNNKFVHALIAFCVAILFLVSSQATRVISIMAPWFTVMFIFIIFILVAFKTMGVTDGQIMNVMKGHTSVVWWIIAIAIIIGIVSMGDVFGQRLLTQQPGYEDAVQNADGTYTLPSGEIIEEIPTTNTQTNNVAGSSFHSNVALTIFHPKILGLMLVGLIASFSVYFMTRMPT